MTSFLIVSREAPYGTSGAREALELALACALFDQSVALLLLDDAVFQLLPKHDPQNIGQKNLSAMQQSLPLYDVDKIYVAKMSLEARGLSAEQLSLPVELIDSKEMGELMRAYDRVINV